MSKSPSPCSARWRKKPRRCAKNARARSRPKRNSTPRATARGRRNIMKSPALELRRMQMITEVGAEQNTMTIIMMPSEFVEMARAFHAQQRLFHRGRPPGRAGVGRARPARGLGLPAGRLLQGRGEDATAPSAIFEGRRWSVPGDCATVEADGTLRLLGRGSQVINTGGEKVFRRERPGQDSAPIRCT